MLEYEILITKEYERSHSIRLEIEAKIRSLPKGSIQPKNIRGLVYYYLLFRKGDKVKTTYIPEADLPEMKKLIEARKQLEKQLKAILCEEEKLASMIGLHISYKPVRTVDNKTYAHFMSSVAHDYKNMDRDDFLEKYKPAKYRGIQKKYVKGFIDWLAGSYEKRIRKGNDLILDPYTYYMYFDVGDKSVLQEELKSAIPEFLNQGLLITNVQEAVHGT